MKSSHYMRMTVLGVCLSLASRQALAQTATAPATAPSQVRLNLPENVELKVLVDYVGQRQGINFIYDEQIGSKRVTIKAPQEIPAASLVTLMESALRMKGLTLTRTDVPGMMRIEASRQLTAVSTGLGTDSEKAAGGRATLAVTRVFELKHAKPQRVEQVVTPFLSTPTANLTSLAEHNMLIITDYADNMKRLEDLVTLVDRPGREVVVQFMPVAEQDATLMAQQVTQLLAGKSKARDGATGVPTPGATVLADERTNRLAVVGSVDDVEQALSLIKELDVSLGMETKIYTFATASSDQVDRLAKRMIGDVAAKRFYKSVADHDSNLLIVTATAGIHQQVDALCKSLDKPVAETQSPIRFYKLENAKATVVLETLQSIQGDRGLRDTTLDGVPAGPSSSSPEDRTYKGPTEEQVNAVMPTPRGGGATTAPARRKSIELGDTRIMADEQSNTLIVVARPAMHPIYEKLIKRLDIRRPQVLIEATLVTLDTTDEFQLGVEFSKTTSVNGGEGKVLNFSQFGLSTADPSTGALTLKPGVGFNGALISSDLANVIIHALKNDARVHVQAQPSVLVNDNATGKLVSQREEPFVTVNASSQVALNTFGGYSSAGTNISIKPQISEGDHLKLEFDITLSSFDGAGSAGLPPAKQTNSLTSEVTIPDGHTIVLGGLTRSTHDDNVDRIPILGEIPVLEYAFSNRRKTAKKSTLFVFIHAVVLRADKFEDLKTLSSDAATVAGLPSDFPPSVPVEIR